MHPRLRRQIAALGPDLPPAFRQLLKTVDAAYRQADAERDELEQSVAQLTTLLHRAQGRSVVRREGKRNTVRKGERARSRLARLLAKSKMPVLELTVELLVRSGNPAAAKLCGVAPEALAGAEVFTLLAPAGREKGAQRWKGKRQRAQPVARTLACSAQDGRALACDWVLLPRM